MRAFFFATIGWIAISLAIGWCGSRMIVERWQAEQHAALAQAGLQALLSAFNSLAPTDAPEAFKQRISETALRLGAVADFPAVTAKAARSGRILSEPTASGSRLFRIVLPLPESIGGSVRLTRRASPRAALVSWWLTWSWMNLIVLGGLGLVRWRLLHHRRARTDALQRWVDQLDALATESPATGAFLPSEIRLAADPQLGELQDVLQHVSELVTRHWSALLRERARSRLVLGNLHEGVLAIDDAENILLANESAGRLLDEPVRRLEGTPLVQAIRIPLLVSQIHQVLRSHQPTETELGYGNPPRHFEVSIRPLPLDADRSGALVSMRDVSRIRHLEHVRRDFVANASHELKTPIAAIRAYAETLHMGAVENREAVESFLANIIEQADRLNALVQGMLQLARAESGRSISFQTIDVRQTLVPCATAARTLCESKGIVWTDNLADTKIQCRGAPEALQTIVNNLLSNAAWYTPAGGSVRLDVQWTDAALHISVSDTGQGIREEEIDRIFERFYRAARDRAENPSGTGLGLAIVKHLTQEMGGRIVATSQVGKGSTFTVILPVQPAPSTEVL